MKARDCPMLLAARVPTNTRFPSIAGMLSAESERRRVSSAFSKNRVFLQCKDFHRHPKNTRTVNYERLPAAMAMIARTLPRTIVFLGPPGVGKGTYAVRLSRLLKAPHVAVSSSREPSEPWL